MPGGPTTKHVARRGRKRRILAWLFLLAGLLVTGLWIASRWCWIGCWHSTWAAAVGESSIAVSVPESTSFYQAQPPRWFVEPAPFAHWEWFLRGLPGLEVRLEDCKEHWFVRHERWQPFRSAVWGPTMGPYTHIVTIALWPLAATPLAVAAGLFWWERRVRRRAAAAGARRCPACGYDFTGLVSGAPCPECGLERQTPAADVPALTKHSVSAPKN